jgi:hyperosmotically inducible protein
MSARPPAKEKAMNRKRIAGIVLAGAVLIGGGAAYAAEGQADWTTTLRVKLALLDKLGTDSLHVDVDSDAGALTLKGTVDKRETRELAESIARSVESVKSVQNDILLEASVANPNKAGVAADEAQAELKDALLSTKIRLALIDTMGSDGLKIGTEVADGVVNLEFGPELAAQRRLEARNAARGVEGVTKVVSVDKS